MQIDRDLFPYVVYSDDSIVHALQKISRNRAQVVYCISEHGVLEGIVTDGDFRRWVVEQRDINLDVPISRVANTDFVAADSSDSPAAVANKFSERIRSVPVLDDRRRLVAIAWPRAHDLVIEGRPIGDDAPVFIIAEIGNNHNGSLAIAKELVDVAANAGVDCVKFQMRTMDALYIGGDAATRQGQDLGDEYTKDLLSRFQLTDDELFTALDYCRSKGVVPLCTPWDLESLAKLEDYGLPAYKIASADMTNHELVSAAAETGKPLIVSTGMSEEQEIIETCDLLKTRGAPFVLLHCNSTYPAPINDINLKYLDRLRRLAEGPVGYSGHERGINVAIGAVARGARALEKHLTLDRTMEGNDHRVSLLPEELSTMVQAVRDIDAALGDDSARTQTQGERLNRAVLAKSIVAAVDIEDGTTIQADMLAVRSPGRGLTPMREQELIGRTARRDLKAGDFFFESDIEGPGATPRKYEFDRPFGLPVRYHDLVELTEATNLDFVEFHLSYRDLDIDPKEAVSTPQDLGLVVHAPELFPGDHIIDLASPDPEYRHRSIGHLGRVVDLTRRLSEHFASSRPGIILNVGGVSLDAPWPDHRREDGYELVAKGLEELAHPDVQLWPQTMPPFPWHFGGQRFHNLFIEPDEIAAFCHKTGIQICFDLSHTALAANHLGQSLVSAINVLSPHIAHMHIADAAGTGEEGLQIGAGEIDFGGVAEALHHTPDSSFIPEIWQGHKNGGEGFWKALDRLEGWF